MLSVDLLKKINFYVLVDSVLHEFESMDEALQFIVQKETENKRVKFYRHYVYKDTSLDELECTYSTTF